MNPFESPYHVHRRPVFGARGVVATSQIVASQAGYEILRAGGTAVDAIIAAATTLAVTEPTSNGIGSDAFALVWDGGALRGLNASGRAPAAASLETLRQAGHTSMPARSWHAVTVPGAPGAWRDLHERFGRLPFAQVLAPAIQTAEQGFAVSPVTGRAWATAARQFAQLEGPEFRPWFDTFAANGVAPAVGQIWTLPDHARTLRRIAESRAADFYTGDLARRIGAFAAETGGWLTADDLAQHTSTWVEPIQTGYRGYEVWEIPPNGQGLTALIALNILEGFDLARLPRESVEAYHLQIEAMKLAFADAHRYIADPEHADVPTRGLLAKRYAEGRRELIGRQAEARAAGDPPRGGTVYLAAADGDGMMVSYIQSNYQGFGSGIVVPGTGVALQNRGAGFVLDPTHPNALAPRKRPYHTIIPSFLTRGGQPVGPFGVMGGFMQPQGHAQMVLNTVDWGMNPQAALDAPRWQVTAGLGVDLEPEVGYDVVQGLLARGHDVRIATRHEGFGKGQLIWRQEGGGYVAGSEPRSDGGALAY